MGKHLAVIAATAVVTFFAIQLWMRPRETRPVPAPPLTALTEETTDPAVWGKLFPFQFQGYRSGVPVPEYGEMRGHAFSLKDREETGRIRDPRLRRVFSGRPKERPQPAACLYCHGSALPFYRREGGGDIQRGFTLTCRWPYFEVRRSLTQPVACIDCHEPSSMRLRLTRPAFLQLYTGERSHQELRTLVCAQCHAEYYLAGPERLVTYPWAKGMRADEMEAYYDEIGFRDWAHAETGAAVVKARHPQFEMWSQGMHARSGVACADCHMPAQRRGAIYVTDHVVRSPLDNVERACLRCHSQPAHQMRARATQIQDRTTKLFERALAALVDLYDDLHRARMAGAAQTGLVRALHLQRKAQWRLDFVHADGSKGFHAAQESARLLAESIDYSRLGQLALQKLKPDSQ